MYEIDIKDVYFSYGTQKVLEDVNLTVQSGESICLIGPSGCGKSTLLRLIAGLSSPSSGVLTINGQKITGAGLDRGVVFQDYSLFHWLTALQNITLALKQAYKDKTKSEIKEIAANYLDLVGLSGSFHKLPKELSGGMRQRAAIAQVFAINPPVLLMDEPFGALDAITRAHLQDLLLNLWDQAGQRQKTILFVTHDVDEALLLADKIAVFTLNPGKIKTVVPIDLPRPRVRKQLHGQKKFHELRDTVLNLLNESIIYELEAGENIYPGGDGI